ncbi:fucose 4-O-acetylase-like acetyltransferase [Marisediminicola sp. UYEF4]|uniref:acyltransferase family protein n=1 Tax=Marisediminicola sp. UYEF4 TaxID=1756384 RepID=UPI00339905A9
MPTPAHKRSAALDAVRVLGVAAVVVGHAIPDEGFRTALFGWHVPLFFFLSGYLWKRNRNGIRDEWRSRWRSLAGPYLFWLAVIGVPYAIVLVTTSAERDLDDWIGPLLGGANANEPFTTFWFLSVLLFSVLLFRVVMALPLPFVWLVAATGLLAGYLIGPQLAFSPLGIGSALPCLVFLLAGFLLRQPIEWLTGRHPAPRLLLGLLLTVVPEVLVVAGVVEPFDIKFGNWGTPVAAVAVAVAISAGLVVVADLVYDEMPRPVERATIGLAFASLCVVLVHPVVQWASRPFEVNPLVSAALMLVIPWAIGSALRHTRLSWWATGTPRAGRPAAVAAG